MRNTVKLYMLGGGLVAAMALAFLMIGAMANSEAYLTVSQLAEHPGHYSGQAVQMTGDVVPNSLTQDGTSGNVTFRLVDTTNKKDVIPVYFTKTLPDDFSISPMAEVSGHLDTQGVFQADTVSTKCPSHYAAAATTTAGQTSSTTSSTLPASY